MRLTEIQELNPTDRLKIFDELIIITWKKIRSDENKIISYNQLYDIIENIAYQKHIVKCPYCGCERK